MQKIIILDFGSQTTQLIGRRVRELDTFCEILPYNKFPQDTTGVIGVILSGSPRTRPGGVQGRLEPVCRQVSRARNMLRGAVHSFARRWKG